MNRLNTYNHLSLASGSTFKPVKLEDTRIAFGRNFAITSELLGWLDFIQFTAIQKLSERQAAALALQELLHTGKECFDIAHLQPKTGKAAKDPEDVDEEGRTVVVLSDKLFNHYYQQMRSLFLNNSSGKQQPGSGNSAKGATNSSSIGDLQTTPDDALLAFQRSIPKIQELIVGNYTQLDLNTRFGWKSGTALQDPVQNDPDFEEI